MKSKNDRSSSIAKNQTGGTEFLKSDPKLSQICPSSNCWVKISESPDESVAIPSLIYEYGTFRE
jgi:hypothetical protein